MAAGGAQGAQLQYLKGIGEARARAFARLGVRSIPELVNFFPRAYEDRTACRSVSRLVDGETACVRCTVTSECVLMAHGAVRFTAADATGRMSIIFFNQSWLARKFRRGDEYVFYGKAHLGKYGMSFANPLFEPAGEAGRVTGRIVPVYRLTAGLKQSDVERAVRQALDRLPVGFEDAIPARVAEEYSLCSARYAYENIHFPEDMRALALARRRLVFSELFALVCALALVRGEDAGKPGARFAPADFSAFTASLPFKPTRAQLRAMGECAGDMSSGRAMNRLVQGDVGCGKTLVAAALIWYAAQNGCQSAFMAPTELLAEQHYATLSGFLAPFGLKAVKLTGSMGARAKREALDALASGEAALAVGTHALISGGVSFSRLGLVVTDEQHRFGVAQRSALAEKGESVHVLVMSATPIPRTLALIIYGDLDVSIIDELPPGRERVDTFAVTSAYHERLNNFILRLVGEGRQVFVVCPAIEPGEEAPPKTVTAGEYAARLGRELKGVRVGCVHGRMKARERDAIMSAFTAGDIDVLVSTTVIEVGVDVPNAALMIVMDADRFGLSQLHQLRGRVGRGQHKSWCVLVSDTNNEESIARLKVMTRVYDGFKIAEEDLRLRGPGDFFGARQHGLPELHIADLGADMDVLQCARGAATPCSRQTRALRKPGTPRPWPQRASCWS